MSDSNLALEDLYCQQRLNTKAMSPWQWLAFIVYFPLGCLLAIVRFALVFVTATFVPETYRYPVFRYIGGLCCRAATPMEVPDHGVLVLSNHSNYLDPIVLSAALAKRQHLGTVIWHGVNFFSRVICRPTLSVMEKGGNRRFLDRLDAANKQHNMIVFPEGAVTDNISALLQFQRSAFRLKQPIYLVAIKYHRAMPFLRGKAMSKQMGIEVLVDLFQPWIGVELIPLGRFDREQYQTPQQQADAAQKLLAEALGLKTSRWSKQDRHRYLFRK